METLSFHKPIKIDEKLTGRISHRRDRSHLESELEKAEIRVKALKNMIDDRRIYPSPVISGCLYPCSSHHFNELLYPSSIKILQNAYGLYDSISFADQYGITIAAPEVIGNLYCPIDESKTEVIRIPEIQGESSDIIHVFGGSLTYLLQNGKMCHSDFRCAFPVRYFRGETDKDSGDAITLTTDLGETVVLVLMSNAESLTFKESLDFSLTGGIKHPSREHDNK